MLQRSERWLNNRAYALDDIQIDRFELRVRLTTSLLYTYILQLVVYLISEDVRRHVIKLSTV